MSRQTKGLAGSVKSLLSDLPDEIQKLPSFLQDFALNTILPIAFILGAVAGILRFVSISIGLLFPPGAIELHK